MQISEDKVNNTSGQAINLTIYLYANYITVHIKQEFMFKINNLQKNHIALISFVLHNFCNILIYTINTTTILAKLEKKTNFLLCPFKKYRLCFSKISVNKNYPNNKYYTVRIKYTSISNNSNMYFRYKFHSSKSTMQR